MNNFSYPGFLFCPGKPHIRGKKYHALCFSGIDIMYDREIVEGGGSVNLRAELII